MRDFLIGAVMLSLLAVVGCGDDDPTNPGGGGGHPPLNLTDFQDAALVIGQADMVSGTADAGSTTNAIGLHDPFGGADGALYVVDQLNNRVLGFAGVPTSDGATASFVLGQPDFTTNTPGLSAQNFNRPTDCAVWGGKLFVVDAGPNRVLIWNSLPTGNVPADVVVGQTVFISANPGLSASELNNPIRVAVAGGKLFVADLGNNRVLIWNSIPTTNGAPASVVVGQSDFTSNTPGLTFSKFGWPRGLWTDGTRLVIGEATNDRVLIWNTIPTANGAAADVVVGAGDFTIAGSNTPSATSIGDPVAVTSDGTNLFVSDFDFHRVMVFSPIPTTNGASAAHVLGQATFAASTANDADQNGVMDAAPTARTLTGPNGLRVIGNRLFVTDQGNHRVLIFNGQ